MDRWLKQAREHGDTHIRIMLVGNKSDLTHQRSISQDEASRFAAANGLSFVETSAMDSSNVHLLFRRLLTGKKEREGNNGKGTEWRHGVS